MDTTANNDQSVGTPGPLAHEQAAFDSALDEVAPLVCAECRQMVPRADTYPGVCCVVCPRCGAAALATLAALEAEQLRGENEQMRLRVVEFERLLSERLEDDITARHRAIKIGRDWMEKYARTGAASVVALVDRLIAELRSPAPESDALDLTVPEIKALLMTVRVRLRSERPGTFVILLRQAEHKLRAALGEKEGRE